MNLSVNLNNLIEGKFRFYLNDSYRRKIFSDFNKLYNFGDLAKNLDIDRRNLFGIRRGWDFRNKIKEDRPISAYFLLNMISLSGKSFSEFESNINYIRLGNSGRKSKISLPFFIDLENESILTFNRVLAENIFIKDYIKTLSALEEPEYFKLRMNKKTRKFIPEEILFDELFAREFGKWFGDKCGGSRKVGLANKEINLINDFKEFLVFLGQKDSIITLTCRHDYKPSDELMRNADKTEFRKSQYGDYCYRVDLSNRELKQFVFDYFKDNIYDVLRKSPKHVRHAFYAGLFDAEGSVEIKSNRLSISFGFNLNKFRNNQDYLRLLKEVCKFYHLLRLDGFNPRISRKLCNTERSKTLKYDLTLLNSIKTRKEEISFIKDTIFKYVTHNEKIRKFNNLEGKYIVKDKEKDSVQPEINLGLVGH